MHVYTGINSLMVTKKTAPGVRPWRRGQGLRGCAQGGQNNTVHLSCIQYYKLTFSQASTPGAVTKADPICALQITAGTARRTPPRRLFSSTRACKTSVGRSSPRPRCRAAMLLPDASQIILDPELRIRTQTLELRIRTVDSTPACALRPQTP